MIHAKTLYNLILLIYDLCKEGFSRSNPLHLSKEVHVIGLVLNVSKWRIVIEFDSIFPWFSTWKGNDYVAHLIFIQISELYNSLVFGLIIRHPFSPLFWTSPIPLPYSLFRLTRERERPNLCQHSFYLASEPSLISPRVFSIMLHLIKLTLDHPSHHWYDIWGLIDWGPIETIMDINNFLLTANIDVLFARLLVPLSSQWPMCLQFPNLVFVILIVLNHPLEIKTESWLYSKFRVARPCLVHVLIEKEFYLQAVIFTKLFPVFHFPSFIWLFLKHLKSLFSCFFWEILNKIISRQILHFDPFWLFLLHLILLSLWLILEFLPILLVHPGCSVRNLILIYLCRKHFDDLFTKLILLRNR